MLATNENSSAPSDFQKDFDKLLAESITQRQDTVRQTNVNEIVIPLASQKMSGGQSSAYGGQTLAPKHVAFGFGLSGLPDGESPQAPTTMNLNVMLRGKSNKAQLKSVEVPLDSELAMSMRQQEEAARLEQQQHKQLTLRHAERSELSAADMHAGFSGGGGIAFSILSQSSSAAASGAMPGGGVISNRGAARHQHQKGVPDVDKIFR